MSIRTGRPWLAAVRTLALILTAWAVLAGGCLAQGPAPIQAPRYQGPPAKYVILFIGDGMGLAQRTATELYLAAMDKTLSKAGVWRLAMNRMPAQGLTTTFGADTTITESSAAGTALASGVKTTKGSLGVDTTKTKPLASLADLAKRKGLKAGVVTTASIDHATPAVFYAHQPRRNWYYQIGMELANSQVDYFGGGGFLKPKGKDGKQPDVLAAARAKGFTVFRTAREILDIPAGTPKVLAICPVLDREASMNFEIDRKADEPSLADFTRKGIQVLDNPAGFFMMIEGGKIDWACHAHDAATCIRDVISLDQAIQEGLKFYQAHKDQTLLVVVADHETGGMSIGNTTTGYTTHLERLALQKMSATALAKIVSTYRKTHMPKSARFEELLGQLAEATGLVVPPADQPLDDPFVMSDGKTHTDEQDDADDETLHHVTLTLTGSEMESLRHIDASMKKFYPTTLPYKRTVDTVHGGKEPLATEIVRILDHKAGIAWATWTHSGIPVPVSAVGVGQETFTGLIDNTDVAHNIMAVMGLENAK